MNVIINVIGPEITMKRKIALELVSPTVRGVVRILQGKKDGPWKRLVKDDESLADGCVALVNGRNIMSLEGYETEVHEGDEIRSANSMRLLRKR
jgi:molybdopterin converting factor small subunit